VPGELDFVAGEFGHEVLLYPVRDEPFLPPFGFLEFALDPVGHNDDFLDLSLPEQSLKVAVWYGCHLLEPHDSIVEEEDSQHRKENVQVIEAGLVHGPFPPRYRVLRLKLRLRCTPRRGRFRPFYFKRGGSDAGSKMCTHTEGLIPHGVGMVSDK